MRLPVLSSLFFAIGLLILLSGCLGDKAICPSQGGQVLCGYCKDDRALTGNPHGGQCRYCPQGSYCSGDVCGDIKCVASGGGNGNNVPNDGNQQQTTYYASCSGCNGAYRTYSYRGPSYDTCNAYYQACVVAECEKILDNCR